MQFENGRYYTVSRSVTTGDRSYIGYVWKLLAHTETVVVLEAHDFKEGDCWRGKRHVLDHREYEFTPADNLLAVLKDTVSEPA